MLTPDLQRLATHYATTQGMGDDDSVVRTLMSQLSADPRLLEQVVTSERNALAGQDLVNSDYALMKSIGVSDPPPIQRPMQEVQQPSASVQSGPSTVQPEVAAPPAPSGVQVQAATPPITASDILADQQSAPGIPDPIGGNGVGSSDLLISSLLLGGAGAAGLGAYGLRPQQSFPNYQTARFEDVLHEPVKQPALPPPDIYAEGPIRGTSLVPEQSPTVEVLSQRHQLPPPQGTPEIQGPTGQPAAQLTGRSMPTDLVPITDPNTGMEVGRMSPTTGQAYHANGIEVTDGLTKHVWLQQLLQRLRRVR